jgi:hypothetical protein
MRRRKKNPTKICPRCKIRLPEEVDTCPDCSLSFDRLSLATNKDAKRKIKRGERDYIIKTNKLPSDVKFHKLLLMSIFLGAFGGHCYYVGRYLRGVILTLNMALMLVCVIFNSSIVGVWNGVLIEILGIIVGIFLLVWMYDVWMVMMKRFKVPVAIDLKEDEEIK